jgi:RimJ/RimL family protein N-acetyltransferase
MKPSDPRLVTSDRLVLRHAIDADADFLVALTNDADFLRFIGDRCLRTREDAVRYLHTGPFARGASEIGLRVVVDGAGQPCGVCGLLQREGLDDVDLGFAFSPSHRGRGLAMEAAAAMLQHGLRQLQLPRVVAIVDPSNERSIALLAKLGMRFEREMRLARDEKLLQLYVVQR